MYYHHTSVGTFLIVELSGRWHILYKDESLGSYINPGQAADDLARGHIFSLGIGIDTSKLDVPRDLEEWGKGTP